MTVMFSFSTVVMSFVIGAVLGLAVVIGVHWLAYIWQHIRGK